ncbi:hypothetical protein [Desulfobacter latus]|uniref:Uncharacterized protein n=1 Tax=Desulfobacter latus TaxID=2292 RepID=A0A850T5H9_9BACT|nr:hypothetical protein [Desulfobacter latus]NWH06351.1 hypothetical protein [Desulfobacter latus]
MKTLCSHSKLPEKPETSPTVGDIFREYGPAFRASNRLHPRQHKVMYDIFNPYVKIKSKLRIAAPTTIEIDNYNGCHYNMTHDTVF